MIEHASRHFAQLAGCFCIAVAAHAQGAPARADRAEHHEFVIANFRTEGGVTLSKARIVYGTYGHLNAAHDNVVLLPSHYMANHHGYEWLIGPGLALDTAKLFLVATELFGNGASSSPSNTPEPFHGPRFPVDFEHVSHRSRLPHRHPRQSFSNGRSNPGIGNSPRQKSLNRHFIGRVARPIGQAVNLMDDDDREGRVFDFGIDDETMHRAGTVLDIDPLSVARRFFQPGLGPILGGNRQSGAHQSCH